jgi:small-conductance mechanosensitive channel
MTVQLLISVLAALGTLALIGLYRAFVNRLRWSRTPRLIVKAEMRARPSRAWDVLETLPDAEDPALDLRRRTILRAANKAEDRYEKGEITENELKGIQVRVARLWVELARRDHPFGGDLRDERQGNRPQTLVRDVYAIIGEPGFRVLVATIITILGLPVCFFVVLSGSKFDDTARNFASGTIGAILGFWLKP